MERQWEIANARIVRDYEKDIISIVKHGVADSVFAEPNGCVACATVFVLSPSRCDSWTLDSRTGVA